MRLLLAVARTQSLAAAAALAAGLVVLAGVLGARLLPVPFLADAVQAGRVLPAPLAGCGALVVAAGWSEHERTSARPAWVLALARWVAGAAVVASSAYLAGAGYAVVAVLFGVQGVLAAVLPRHWWLALPPLLYLQLYLPEGFLPQ